MHKPRKRARRKVVRRSHGEISTFIATAPATALRINPNEIHITSRIIIFFKIMEYKIIKKIYAKQVKKKTRFRKSDKMRESRARRMEKKIAIPVLSSPEAIGLFRFCGWSLSFSLSIISFRM